MYDGCRVGFYECVCAEVSSCVGLYKDVDVYDGHEAGFFLYVQERSCFTFIEL